MAAVQRAESSVLVLGCNLAAQNSSSLVARPLVRHSVSHKPPSKAVTLLRVRQHKCFIL